MPITPMLTRQLKDMAKDMKMKLQRNLKRVERVERVEREAAKINTEAMKKNAQRHAELIEEAKRNASSDKEPFSFEEFSKYHRDTCDFQGVGGRVNILNYPQVVQDAEMGRAEEYYYITKPELKTMKELGEYLTYLDSWG